MIDHNFQVCGRGIGTLDTELVPGLYKLRYRVGLTVSEAYQAIEPGRGPVTVSAPPTEYSSAAPVRGTLDREPYGIEATELSRKVHATFEKDSQVFVFARGGRAGRSANPAAGLSLHYRDGTRVVDLGKLAKRAGATSQWAGCTVAVPPGEYRLRQRLRLAVPQQRHLEQVIVASPGWQTQIFLTPFPGEPTEGGRPGGLIPARTSVLQARIDRGFGAHPDAARLADLARIGLTDRRAIIALADLPAKLFRESANPMLGIYTAHALLQAGEFDQAQLREIVSTLRSLLGKHPDVEALAHALGVPDPAYVFECPPMLSNSWSIILAASARHPGLVPRASLSERVSPHLWGTGPWLLWLYDELANAQPRVTADAPGMVAQVADAALLGYPSRRAALDNATLTDREEAMLTRVSRPFRTPEPGKSPHPEGSRQPALDISRDLAEALDLPPAAIPPVAASLVRKLEHAAHSGTRFRRLRWRLRGPLVRMSARFRRRLARMSAWFRRRVGLSPKRPWRGRRQWQIGPVVIGAAAIIWLTSVIVIASTTFRGSPPGFEIAVDDILSGLLALLLSLTVGSAVFLWRRSRVHLPFLRRIQDKPHRTVGGVTGDVVGRDELCQVIIDNLRDRDTRRTHVIVGGVGSGKTALLAQLSRLLAERGALPVSVSLHDARHSLDFRDLAHQRFIADDETAPLSDTDGETLWRHLSRHDMVVVLADDLEEALVGDPGATEKLRTEDRENIIRMALRQVREDRLPLVVASRPDSSLVEAEAAIVELEPLNEESVPVQPEGSSGEDERRLNWLVAASDAAESPLYLQIARQLKAAGLMTDITAPHNQRGFDEPLGDRARLQLLLLQTWMDALLAGQLGTELPLSPADRKATVDQLSVLACLGLEHGTHQVTFDDFEALRNRKPQPAFITEVAETLRKAGRQFNVGLAAIWGTELGLVQARPNGVRFPDSLIEAYLGSRLIKTATGDEQYLSSALTEPGQEFLLALVMSSQAITHPPGPGEARPDELAARSSGLPMADLLREQAAAASSVTALYLYAAALQIDRANRSRSHEKIAREIADRWSSLAADDQRSLDQAKLNLVRRLDEAARTVAEKQQAEADYPGKPAYRQLFRMAMTEPARQIRMEIAQRIGALGDAAFDALPDLLTPPHDPHEQVWLGNVVRAWLAPLLAGSTTYSAGAAQKNLSQWLRFVSERNDPKTEPGTRLSLEVALAQGFKYAANRRDTRPRANPQAHAFLLERAREMLSDTSFWFSRLTLVQALCLLTLASTAEHSAGSRDGDHAALVAHWAGMPGGQAEHPFVAEARKLAVRALETGQPERFIWIDEGNVAARIGSPPADPGAQRRDNLWIPPSVGWPALDPSTQKLLGEVLLLLNLAERGADPTDRNRSLQRTSTADLPPCLTGTPLPLDPARTLSRERESSPGSSCLAGCRVQLCPYPPQGQEVWMELSEAFCRRQEALVTTRDLKQFWRDMAQRAQPYT